MFLTPDEEYRRDIEWELQQEQERETLARIDEEFDRWNRIEQTQHAAIEDYRLSDPPPWEDYPDLQPDDVDGEYTLPFSEDGIDVIDDSDLPF